LTGREAVRTAVDRRGSEAAEAAKLAGTGGRDAADASLLTAATEGPALGPVSAARLGGGAITGIELEGAIGFVARPRRGSGLTTCFAGGAAAGTDTGALAVGGADVGISAGNEAEAGATAEVDVVVEVEAGGTTEPGLCGAASLTQIGANLVFEPTAVVWFVPACAS